MLASVEKYFFNSNYFIQLKVNNTINLYKIDNLHQIISNINYDQLISDIEFNPVKENIIIISFYNGYCKICNISDNGIEKKITFEGISNKRIIKSIFNEFNTNIIASVNLLNKIIIWDVRKQKFENIIDNKDEIINIKWNKKIKDILEITTTNEIKLFDVKGNKIILIVKYSDIIVNYSFLTKETIILIKSNKLEKFIHEKYNKSLEIKNISDSNENLIRNDILIILSLGKLNFVHVINLNIIFTLDCCFSNFYNFIECNDKDELLFYYYNNNKINKVLITLGKEKMNKIRENSDLNNFINNFYQQYEKLICKYICLLNFGENIEEEKSIYIKQYMKIKEIGTFFDRIKIINIFDRKNLIEQILEKKFINKEISKIFENDNFEYIKICFSIFNKKIENKKEEIISKIEELYKNNKGFIKDMYFQLIKLLTIDNTNDKLLEIYLIFLNKYESTLLKDESIKYIEKYNVEVNYYYPCFSKEKYKALFNIDKRSEKEIVLNFLKKAHNTKKFLIDNEDFQLLVDEAIELSSDLPDFNQPIEYDCKNIELRWHKIKTHLAETFKELKFGENYKKMEKKKKEEIQRELGRIKNGIRIVMNKNLLTNDIILNNKYKLDCAISLIINPCNVLYQEADFYSNLLICEKLDENKLYKLEKEKDSLLKINKNNNTLTVTYDNYTFKDPEYLCVDNLLNKHFTNNKKYNFDYLSKYSVKNQDKIKSFLKTILTKKVFLDIYEILFGNKEYKYLKKAYLDELIDNRIKFVPIGPLDSLALSDKISISTMISIKDKIIKDTNQDNGIIEISNEIKNEILSTGSYVSIGEHEIFHLFNCIPYYENNCSLSIKTPRKKYFNECEGGRYLEYLLYDKPLNEINMAQALYILNESNYDKTLIEFKIGFENLDIKDLNIKGIFSGYNSLISLDQSNKFILENISIVHKTSSSNIPSTCIRLKKDVIGNLEKPNKNLISKNI